MAATFQSTFVVRGSRMQSVQERLKCFTRGWAQPFSYAQIRFFRCCTEKDCKRTYIQIGWGIDVQNVTGGERLENSNNCKKRSTIWSRSKRKWMLQSTIGTSSRVAIFCCFSCLLSHGNWNQWCCQTAPAPQLPEVSTQMMFYISTPPGNVWSYPLISGWGGEV